MQTLKSILKHFFQVTNTLWLLDKLNFQISKQKHKKTNSLFKKENPTFKLPPDYYLYETSELNYKKYKEGGFLTATEVNEWTKKYLPETIILLEWGCGVARVIRHFKEIINDNSKLFACDINSGMIHWNKNNIPDVQFDLISYKPPAFYKPDFFDFVYALSVFTHIEFEQQTEWLREISRILKPRGIFLFTTHGKFYFNKLNSEEKTKLKLNGAYTISYNQKGHRMMTTYNDYTAFKKHVEKYFDILEYYDGQENLAKLGGQDLWIVKRNEIIQVTKARNQNTSS